MFTLYMKWEASEELNPEDIQFILSPSKAMKLAAIFYELDYAQYHQQHCPRMRVPERRRGVHRYFSQPYKRKPAGHYDGLYDDIEWNIRLGWMVGIDTSEPWDHFSNPFYFDKDSNLIFDCFMDYGTEMFEQEVRSIYERSLNNHHGRKPDPTVKQYYFDAPVQHAQATKAINSKAAGRLLAAGGIYNSNIEGFHQTAKQLGGDAPAGYDQVMKNKGLLIAGASVAAGLGLGRLGAAGEISEIASNSKIPSFKSPYSSGFTSESGALLNAEHAVVDPKKLASYALNLNHPTGGNKARVFESALGYNPTNADILASRIQEGVLTNPAKVLDKNNFGQLMGVDMPILGVNGETVLVRTGWMYETDAVVPRMTTLFIK
ncbi:DUF6883 domain-containing protein [Chimaeribacter arupi]|uniref:Uncharacterized protein n=1 Tax=Chimaeribacter arupi TaxID=2060066 RepID=A0A2N5EI89_9GAMM|nr:DUF6883 domain-containing protein [Chimaeribacter arupi]PLR44352.1 hypothetical protein CYR34_19250 [Chimaeribacter arupi]